MSSVPHRKLRIRMTVVVVLTVVAYIALMVRMAFLQLVDAAGYQEKAVTQQLSISPITPLRGTIYDTNGVILAQSATVWMVSVAPNQIKDEDRNKVAQELARILELDPIDVAGKVNQTSMAYVRIKGQVEKTEVDEIRLFMQENGIGSGAIGFEEDAKRYYPFHDFAASVLGFTGSEHQGLYGLEAYYDSVLSGTPGRYVTMSDARGGDMPDTYKETIAPVNGDSLVTTIDVNIQSFLENALETGLLENKVQNRVCGIVMDVNTGAILGMASKPDFDPNEPFTIWDASAWEAIQMLSDEEQKEAIGVARETQWKNKGITEIYEPGSVFKVITAASALDAGVVTMDSTFSCETLERGGWPIRCWKRTGSHGVQDFTHTLMHSCNPAYVKIAERLGATEFFRYFTAFGFTEKTGIDLPGEVGGIFHEEDGLGPAALATSSFGQTNKVTPIQLITAISAAVNGGYLVTPHLVKSIVDNEGNVIESFDNTIKRQVISEETSKHIAEMMEAVVNGQGGSGKNAYVSGYRIGGKTGTSEKTETRDASGEVTETISSFLGIAPADDPQIAILILLDTPYDTNAFGSTIAAPIVGQVFSEVLPYIGVEAKYTAEELEEVEVAVPYLIGNTSMDAMGKARAAGFEVRVEGENGQIVRQVPAYGSTLKKSGTIIIYTENADDSEKTALVPNLIGCTPAEANALLTNAGLNMKILRGDINEEGAIVGTQSVVAGVLRPIGTIVEVEFVVEIEERTTGL